MRAMRVVRAGALAAVLAGGCGTVRNFATGDPEIYGGVQKDIEFIQTPRHPVKGVGVNPMTLALLAPVDLCLSLVADTVALPVAIYMRQNKHPGDDSTPAPADGPESQPQPGGR